MAGRAAAPIYEYRRALSISRSIAAFIAALAMARASGRMVANWRARARAPSTILLGGKTWLARPIRTASWPLRGWPGEMVSLGQGPAQGAGQPGGAPGTADGAQVLDVQVAYLGRLRDHTDIAGQG